jgi:hypothetical protein
MAGGHHRLAAMKLLGERTIPAQIRDWDSIPPEQQDWFRGMFEDLDW